MVIASRLSVVNCCTGLHWWLLVIETFRTQGTNKQKRNHETAHSVTSLSIFREIQAMINLKGYVVQKRFLMLTFSPRYKQCHRLIAFVGINAALLPASLAHGCNTKGQGKAWAVSVELRQHRSIRVQGCGCIVWSTLPIPGWQGHATTQGNKNRFIILGVPVTLCTFKEVVLWMGLVGFPARPSGLLILQVFTLCRCPLTQHFPEYFTLTPWNSFRENASFPKSGTILGGQRNQR